MGQITGKDNNRVPTVKECNDAFGGDYVTQDDLSGFLTTSDISESHGISQCWVQLPGGLIIQGGYGGTNTTSRQTFYFPKVFPSKCIAVVVSGERSGDGANGYNYVWNVTRSGFEASFDKSPGFWMAIGY